MNERISGPAWDLTPVYAHLKDPQIDQDFKELETLLSKIGSLNTELDNDCLLYTSPSPRDRG